MHRIRQISQFIIILLLFTSPSWATEGDPILDGIQPEGGGTINVQNIAGVTAIDDTTEATLESELDHDQITGAGTVDTAAEVNAIETDPVYSAWDKDYSDLINAPTIPDSLDDLSGDADDITEGTTHLFLTSAERTILGNTSGTNTGDQTLSGLGAQPLSSILTGISGTTPASGYLHYNGSTYSWDTPSGSSHDAVTLGTANGLSLSTQELSLGLASSSATGALSSTDWTTFNGKQTAYTILSTLGGLSNSAGWLYNNGSGTLSYSTPTASNIGLGNVENTALSTWAGSSNITTLGTIATGTWHGTAIGDSYISSASTWSGKQTAYTILSTLGALSNSTGYLYNNGSGTLSWASGSSGMTWPSSAGIAVYAGSSAWGTSITDNHSNWDAGYTYRLTSASGTSPLTLTLSSNALTGSISDASTSSKGIASFNSSHFGVSSGAVSLATSGVTAGSYTNAGITVDAYGRVTAASSGSSGGISGLTAGYVPYATSSTAVANSGLYWDSTNSMLGIGTTSPQEKMHVYGTGTTRLEIEDGGTSAAALRFTNTEGSYQFYTDAGNLYLYDLTAATQRVTLNSSGNVGIGTTSPSAKLHSLATTEQLRLGYDASNYASFTVLSTGDLTIYPSGGSSKGVYSYGFLATNGLYINSSNTDGIGYIVGGTVTQSTSKSTGVTLNQPSGAITMNSAALAAAAEVTFTVTDSCVLATDVPVVAIKSGGTAGAYLISVGAVATGSFKITLSNCSTGSLSESVVISFALIKGATS